MPKKRPPNTIVTYKDPKSDGVSKRVPKKKKVKKLRLKDKMTSKEITELIVGKRKELTNK